MPRAAGVRQDISKMANGISQRLNLPATLEGLLQPPRPKKIRAILKRGQNELVPFNRDKIAVGLRKAREELRIGPYSESEVNEIVENIVQDLERQETYAHSGTVIPNVDDANDSAIKVLEKRKDDMGDPTVHTFRAYRLERDSVRNLAVNLPFQITVDSTDRQLHIHQVSNGHSSKFDKRQLIKLIVENTSADYEAARTAVKKVERYLVERKNGRPVSADEITTIVNAALYDAGYSKESVLGGEHISLTLGNIEQTIFDKSVENSNIKANNPEAVNLALAELGLKEFALRKVFDPEVAEAHKNGTIHLHDLGYAPRVYCSAHSIEFIKRYGLDKVVRNLDSKSAPARSPQVLNNHVHTFLAAIQSSYAGALGFPMLNTLYAPALLKEVEIVEGTETIRDETGNELRKIPRRVPRHTLEDMIEEGQIRAEDWQESNSTKVLREYSKKELKQIAQNLIFGASQSAFSRGGQTLFIDFNIDLDTPAHVRGVPAMFLGGEYAKVRKNERGEWEVVGKTSDEPERYRGVMENKGHVDAQGKPLLEPANKNGDVIQPENGGEWATYGHELLRRAGRNFARALFEVAKDGDKYGNPFNFPKIDVHVGRETFEDPESLALLNEACDVVEKNDSVYFMFDRGDGMNVSQCCRLRERITDPEILKHPEKMRFCGFQNVSINLPQAAYKANGENLEAKLNSTLEEIDKTMLVALKAHANKRRFMQTLFDTPGSPMHTMGGKPSDDGEPYINLAKSTYIFGIVGLNEAVQHITGKQLDEDPEAFKVGLRILSHMYATKAEFTRRYGMKCVVEETPGESANRRMAKIDLTKFPKQTQQVIKGSLQNDTVYYTNSSHLRADAPVSGLDRTILQSMMNPMIEAGAITHIFSGEKANRASAVYDFVKSVYDNTQSSQVVFSGEHTVCIKCGAHMRGLKNVCPQCGNKEAESLSQKTRVVGYFSDPRGWNKSKQGELVARQNSAEFYNGQQSSLRNLQGELLESIIEPGKTRIAVIGSKGCTICEEAMKRVERAASNPEYLPPEQRQNTEIVKYDVGSEEGRVYAAIYGAPIDSFPTVVVHRGPMMISKGWEYPYNKPAKGLSSKNIGEMIHSIANAATSAAAPTRAQPAALDMHPMGAYT